MKCGVWNQLKIWSSHLLDNLSNCLMNLKNSGDSTGFEPMTSAMPVQCSNQLSYEVTQLRAGQFVGLMFSRERNASQRSWVRIPLSHLNFSGSWDNCLNCPASTRIISSVEINYSQLNSFAHSSSALPVEIRKTIFLMSLYSRAVTKPAFWNMRILYFNFFSNMFS